MEDYNDTTMQCIKCDSDRLLGFSGKCSDNCYSIFKGKEIEERVPKGIGIGGGGYITIKLCLECGFIQDVFPKGDPE